MQSDNKRIQTPILNEFREEYRKLVKFHLIFLTTLFIEAILFFIFLPWLAKSALTGLVIAFVLITFFSYLTLKSYINARYQERIGLLIEKAERGALSLRPITETVESNKEYLAGFLDEMGEDAKGLNFYNDLPFQFIPKNPFFKPLILKGLIYQEKLLKQAIQERIQALKFNPIQPEKHKHIGSSYLNLAHFYYENGDLKKGKEAYEKAADSFYILLDLTPHDLSLYDELSHIYKLLKEPQKEIETLEKRLSFETSADPLYRLGTLYFETGKHALGFKTYNKLKNLDQAKGDALMLSFKG